MIVADLATIAAKSHRKSLHSEITDVDLAFSCEDQFADDFADSGRVFEPVTGTRRSNNYLIISRQTVDHEICIRGRRIKTTYCGITLIRKPGQPASDLFRVHGLFFFVADCPIHVVRGRIHGVLFACHLNGLAIESGETIEAKISAFFKNPNENWQTSRCKCWPKIVLDPKPVHYLPINFEKLPVLRRQKMS